MAMDAPLPTGHGWGTVSLITLRRSEILDRSRLCCSIQ
jgi:hypothetical protein